MSSFSQKLFFPAVFIYYSFLFILIYPDVVFFGDSFFKRDIFRYYYPVWQFSVDALRRGEFPLWNPYNGYGTPFFANIQNCVLYPFSLLLYLPDYRWAFNSYLLFHLALSAFFVCVWMRDVGASRTASFFSGLAYGLSGYVMCAASVTISLASLAYFPLALLCLRRCFHGGGLLWTSLAALVLVLQYLAGDPAIFFATVLVYVLFTAYRVGAHSWREMRICLTDAWTTVRILALFLLLGAFHWPSFLQLFYHSNRSQPEWNNAVVWSSTRFDLVSLFLPHFSDVSSFFQQYWTRQSWLENTYMGVTVATMAAFALWQDKTANVKYHLSLALFGIFLSMGASGGIYSVLFHGFPFFKFIRYPVRFLFLFHFSAACLAGFGLDALVRRMDQNVKTSFDSQAVRWLGFGLVVLTAVVIASVFVPPAALVSLLSTVKIFLEKHTHLEWSAGDVVDAVIPILANIQRTMTLFLWVAAILFVALRLKPRKALVSIFLISIVFADLAGTNVVEMRARGDWMQRGSENVRIVQQDKDLFRIYPAPGVSKFSSRPPAAPALEEGHRALWELMSPNLLLPMRVAYASSYDSLHLKDAMTLNSRIREDETRISYRLLDMLNAKYFVSLQQIENNGRFTFLRDGRPGALYKNEQVLPRAFLVPEAEYLDRDSILKKITGKEYDPLAKVYVDSPAPQELSSSEFRATAPGPDQVRILKYKLNSVDMQVQCSEPRWLFFSDMFYPGWTVTVNGRSAAMYRANYCFRAVAVPAGNSEVLWNYDPILFKIGCMISALTVFGLLGCAWRRRGVVG